MTLLLTLHIGSVTSIGPGFQLVSWSVGMYVMIIFRAGNYAAIVAFVCVFLCVYVYVYVVVSFFVHVCVCVCVCMCVLCV